MVFSFNFRLKTLSMQKSFFISIISRKVTGKQTKTLSNSWSCLSVKGSFDNAPEDLGGGRSIQLSYGDYGWAL
jgi:hypothetical protein